MTEVSVMPCFNHAIYIEKSIFSVIDQSFEDFELIIVDDCSSDGSRDIIETYAKKDKRIIPVFNKRNFGVSKSRNDALRLAKGNFIGFCDSDDLWEKEKLLKQINYFNLNPQYNALHSDSTIIDDSDIQTGERFSTLFQNENILEGDLFIKLCLRNFVNTSTVLLKRKCIIEAGLFEEDIKYGEDWIYWTRVSKYNLFGYIYEQLSKYRVHNKSTMYDNNGYLICRIMCYNYLLKNYNDIPRYIRSKMEYLIGVNYVSLNNNHKAKDYFLKAIATSPLNIKASIRWLSLMTNI